MHQDILKKCPACGEIKSRSAFGKSNSRSDGLYPYCKECRKAKAVEDKPRAGAYHREYYRNNKDRFRDSNFRRVYNMGLSDYQRILQDQSFGCAICGIVPTSGQRALAVDHDHSCCSGSTSCGKCVRALLCDHCNLVLGNALDRIPILEKCIQYLRRYDNPELTPPSGGTMCRD